MNITSEVNKFFADKLGIKLKGHEYLIHESEFGDQIWNEWHISDPRCRELVRERFRIVTDVHTNSFGNGYKFAAHQHLETQRFYGKTIAEAEIACCLAIYQSQKESSDG